ncbi:MAG TPA: sugar transferase [bacterium]|jgi:exopolysaccharide biosynthesis polyprenyl glycosylphosphotransferase|nr:sugar transferase [bacterium]HOG38194.1 sugar transferase [bacterium]HQI03216.1 sugar transferase [bacterium]
MVKNKLFLNVIEIPLDFILLIVSGIIAYYLRFAEFVTKYRPVIFELPFFLFLQILVGTSFVAIIVFMISGLYSFEKRTVYQKFTKVFSACSTFILILVIAFFFEQRLFSSRFIVVIYWIIGMILLLVERIALDITRRILAKKGIIKTKIILVGNNENTEILKAKFETDKTYGYEVVKQFSINENTIYEIENYISNNEIDEIILTDPYAEKDFVSSIINLCNVKHIVYKYTASLLETRVINFEVDDVAGIPIVEIKRTRLQGWGRIWKRVFDLSLAIIGLIFFIPIYIIIGIIIKLDSRGPILVKLTRIGVRNKEFKMYKFRSMVVNAEKMKDELIKFNERNDGPLFKMKNDPRITRVGKFLRRTSIDEIPQILNVLMGQMSLVGPRAHEPREVAQYKDEQMQLLVIKPGITGMAQVSGRSNLKFEDEVRLDVYYIENWSLMLDLRILLKTIRVLFKKEAV